MCHYSLVYWELDLHPIHAVPRENTILPSKTQSERNKLRLPLRDPGDPITTINSSDNLIKCVFSPLRRKSVAYGECQWRKPFHEVSSFCQTRPLPLMSHLTDGHVKWKRLKTICVEQVLDCDGMRSVSSPSLRSVSSVHQHHKVFRAEPNLAPLKESPKHCVWKIKDPTVWSRREKNKKCETQLILKWRQRYQGLLLVFPSSYPSTDQLIFG